MKKFVFLFLTFTLSVPKFALEKDFRKKDRSVKSVAFLPIINESGLIRLGEYELRLPNEAIKILKKELPTLKAHTPDETLKILEEKAISKKAFYIPSEFQELAKNLPADVFVSGKINLLPSGEIVIDLQIFSFTTEEEFYLTIKELPSKVLQNTIAQLVSLISQYLSGEGKFFIRPVKSETKIALYTNLDPLSSNELVASLLEKKVFLKSLTLLSFNTPEKEDLAYFWNIASSQLSLYQIDLAEKTHIKIFPFTNTWEIAELYNLWEKGEQKKISDKEIFLQKKLGEIFQADYLLFAYAEDGVSFARGIHLDTGELTFLRKKFYNPKEAAKNIILGFAEEILQTPKLPDVSSVGGLTTIASQTGTDLATVAILDFFNRTNKKEFMYLRNSLSSAVSDSMKRLFEYNRAERSQEIVAEKLLEKGIDQAKLSEVSLLTRADYLIFGDFTYDPKSKLLFMEARLYDLFNQREIGRVSEKSPVASKIFDAVDNIANKMVQLIYKMATQEQGGNSL